MSEFLTNFLSSPEGKTLEFRLDSSSPEGVMKTLVAFANSAGGRLIIGVGDNRRILGLPDPLDEADRIRSLVAESIAPRLLPHIELATIDDKTILIIEIYVSALAPHWLKTAGHDHGVFVRIGSLNVPADVAMIAELERRAEDISFDELPMAELSRDDLDTTAMQHHFGSDWRDGEEMLIATRLLTLSRGKLVPTRGAILLFGKERALHFPDAWVQCNRFTGCDRSVTFDHIDLLHESLGDTKFYIATVVASGGGVILRHYTTQSLDDK